MVSLLLVIKKLHFFVISEEDGSASKGKAKIKICQTFKVSLVKLFNLKKVTGVRSNAEGAKTLILTH